MEVHLLVAAGRSQRVALLLTLTFSTLVCLGQINTNDTPYIKLAKVRQ